MNDIEAMMPPGDLRDTALGRRLLDYLELADYLDDQGIPDPGRTTMTTADNIASAADRIVTEARDAMSELPWPAAVAQVASGAARQATAGAGNDAAELHYAHLIIAELAVRLAERDGR